QQHYIDDGGRDQKRAQPVFVVEDPRAGADAEPCRRDGGLGGRSHAAASRRSIRRPVSRSKRRISASRATNSHRSPSACAALALDGRREMMWISVKGGSSTP